MGRNSNPAFKTRACAGESAVCHGNACEPPRKALSREETFAARFDALLGGIRGLGFTAADVWTAHLHPKWATRGHVFVPREALARHGMTVPTMAGYFGDTQDELRTACRLARDPDCTILSGGQGLLKTDRSRLAGILREEGVRLAVENHLEKNLGELLARMGEGDGDVIGAAVDTGWFATQRYRLHAQGANALLLDELTCLTPGEFLTNAVQGKPLSRNIASV